MTPEIRIFFDTEFTSLNDGAELISIGLIDQAGVQSFYAELTDTWCLAQTSDFARTRVLPLLQGGQYQMTMRDLSERLSAWLASFNQPLVLATDSLTWDWPWIVRILKEPGLWPKNLIDEPLLLNMNYLIEFDRFVETVENGFANGLRRHHALDDAQSNRMGWIAAGGDIRS